LPELPQANSTASDVGKLLRDAEQVARRRVRVEPEQEVGRRQVKERQVTAGAMPQAPIQRAVCSPSSLSGVVPPVLMPKSRSMVSITACDPLT